MIATPSHDKACRSFGEQVETRMQEIERLADAGDWDRIETVLEQLPAIIERIPDVERRDILSGTKSRVDQVYERAVAQKEEIAAQLATLKTGRRAVASYNATEDLAFDL